MSQASNLGMSRLVYSPKAYAFVRVQDTSKFPNGLDISEYIVSGEVNRVVNEASTATITLQNPRRQFTQEGSPTFHPMDPITIYLARYRNRPVQVFTGFLDRTPYLQLFPGTCSLQASCTLKRLLYTYWDPALTHTRNFLAKYGWFPYQDGSIRNLGAELKNQVSMGTNGKITDSGFGGLLYAILKEVGNWRDDELHIEALPGTILDEVVDMYKAFEKDNLKARDQFASLIHDIIGAGSSGSGGGSVSLKGNGNVDKTFNFFKDTMGYSDNQAAGATGSMMQESGVSLNTTDTNSSSGAYGIAQWAFERKAALMKRKNPSSLQTQLEYLRDELLGGKNGARDWSSVNSAMKSTKSLEAAVTVWTKQFEIPGPSGEVLNTRLGFAKSVLHSFGGSKSSSGSSSSSGGTDSSTNSRGGKEVTITNPKELIDRVVLPIARKHHIDVTPQSVEAANARHGPTVSGGRSDHQGPPNVAWAVDMSDGVLTKNERALAEDLNKVFHMGWKMGNLTSHTENGFRYQLIHGCSSCGGDHTNHVHFGVRKESSNAKWVGVPGADASSSDSGGGGSNSSGDILSTATAAAFATELNFPSLEETGEAQLLRGAKSLMNDQPLFTFIEQIANASMRSIQSLPNGNFFAFFPDYFGNYFHRQPYWEIDDIEIMEGQIELTDDSLATHVYVVGDTDLSGQIDIVDKLLSGGVVTVFNAFQGKNWILDEGGQQKSNTLKKPSEKDQKVALNFLQKYGARPLLIPEQQIRSPYFEAFTAIQQFQLAWSRQFLTTFQLTFMPELYPGGIASFKGHGIQCYIDSVSHSWDYESGFTTSAQFSAPASYGGGSKLALGMIRGSTTVPGQKGPGS